MRIYSINNFNIVQNISKVKSSVSFGDNTVPLYMIDETGHISKYNSFNEVSRALGVNVETIKKALEENRKVSGVILIKEEDFKKKN